MQRDRLQKATVVKRELLKYIDGILGTSAARIFPAPRRKTFHQIHSILFIRPGGIGDAVLLIPAIQAIKQMWPQAIIDVLAEERNAAIFQLCPDINTIFQYDKPRELLTAIRASYDVVIDTEQWHRLSAIAARLTSAPMTIGFATNERKRLFTHPVPYSQDDFELISFLHLLTPLTGYPMPYTERPFLDVSQVLLDKATKMLSSLSSPKIVALFPGGSIGERRWGANRFHQVAKMLCEQGYPIVAIGGKNDVKAGEEIIYGNSPGLNLCGKLSLPETAAVIKSCALLITGDSGIMHVGYGLGTKIVALFGPGREKKWAPRGERCRIINMQLACSPCTTFGYTPKCQKRAECMRQITADEVFRKSMELLSV
jgi:lipopolysaccharide heptosyltransferase II